MVNQMLGITWDGIKSKTGKTENALMPPYNLHSLTLSTVCSLQDIKEMEKAERKTRMIKCFCSRNN